MRCELRARAARAEFDLAALDADVRPGSSRRPIPPDRRLSNSPLSFETPRRNTVPECQCDCVSPVSGATSSALVWFQLATERDLDDVVVAWEDESRISSLLKTRTVSVLINASESVAPFMD